MSEHSTTPAAAASSPPRGLLFRLWGYFWDAIVRVLWLCGYATVTALAVAFIFIFNDQGQDLLRLSAEHASLQRPALWWNLAFLGGAALLGLILWYSSRRLLDRDFPGERFERSTSAAGRAWWPRIYGASVPFAIGIGFFRIDSDAQLAAWLLGALFLLLGAILLGFFLLRRRLFLKAERRIGLEIPKTQGLNVVDGLLILGSLGAFVYLVAAFVASPVVLPQTLGTPAIVMLGFAGIALFGGLVLTYAFLAMGQPAATPLVLVIAIASAYVNDNHWIRTAEQAPPLPRQPAAAHYQSWRAAHSGAPKIDGREPVILVAAAGGGIRAAYWTAASLAAMEAVPRFSDSLFAISAVSGGSVGAAVYTAVRRDQLDQEAELPADPAVTAQAVRTVLTQDFLSPVVAGLLFPDLAQRFIPYPFRDWDRQRFIELAFEQALDDVRGESGGPLARPFTALYADDHRMRLPSLLLNTTIVDAGRRAIVSNIDVQGIPDAVDLLGGDFSTERILLSAAAGASGRFTYVNPAGSLDAPGAKGSQKIRVVDGGYFENSGSATAIDLLDLLEQGNPGTLFPILVLIRNGPSDPAICQGRPHLPQGPATTPVGPPASDFLSEVAAPIRALLRARDARGHLTEIDAARQVDGQAAQLVEQRLGGAVIEISLGAAKQASLRLAGDQPAARRRVEQALAEPPLGWSLSTAAARYMDQALDTADNGVQKELAILADVLDGQLADYPPCGAR